jgi:phosphatidylinositol alpha-mannosyltransferase
MPNTLSASPLKIGFVLDDSLDKPDGVQQYVLSMGEWLRGQGHDVHYLVSTTTRTDIPNIHNLGRFVTVRFNGNAMGTPLPASGRRIRQLLEDEQFDILHVQLPYSPFLAHKVIMLAPRRTAIVGTFHIVPHSVVAAAASRVLYLWTWRSWRRFDTVFSVSSAAQTFAKRAFRAASSVLPNVIDYARFHTASPFQKDRKTIVFLGRLVPRKGCGVLLEAIAQLKNDNSLPRFKVIICGRGRLQSELAEFVAAQHLDMVEFAGFITEADKPRYLATADVAVFPSSGGESFGIVLLEAMASGKAAVLAGDNDGYRSVMVNSPELLFAPKDSALLASKLRDLLQDDAKRQAIAGEGAEYAATFDVNIVGAKLVNEYNEVLRSRQGVQ